MLKTLLILWQEFFLVNLQLNPYGCGNTTFLSASCGAQSRIIGGTEVSLGKIPWQALVEVSASKRCYICGGTIVTKKGILSAAHCYAASEGPAVPASGAKVYVGFIDRTTKPRVRVVIAIHNHESFKVCSHKNDISLLKLKEDLDLSENIKPICIPTDQETELFVGKIGLISGWGSTEDSCTAKTSKKLLAATVTVIANSDTKCKDETSHSPPDIEMCAFTEGHDAGHGDSGGPLTTFHNGVCLQIGVISGGGVQTCAQKLGGIYTRMNKFYNWVKRIIDGN